MWRDIYFFFRRLFSSGLATSSIDRRRGASFGRTLTSKLQSPKKLQNIFFSSL